MSINLDKVGKLTSFVVNLIGLKGIENSLDDDIVDNLIKQAIDISGIDITCEEIAATKRDITWKFQIFSTPGPSLLEDYDIDNWYDERKGEIEQKFWTRYKNYLIDVKKFSPNIVSTLGEETLDQKLMNYILDPIKKYPEPVLRRGLIIGDVQSGKTSTYIGFMCKAADAGYKVIILLTGTIESLRRQTQERVEEGFIGIDMSANTTTGQRVGVGLDNKPICAMSMTSRKSDFTGAKDQIAVSLSGNNDVVVFVIKKNSTTLKKLTDWLITLNADPSTKKIDLPMLMIDDEADNASINTSDKEDPSRINAQIRKLANIFTKSNYVGFTATPFANVFIDPETDESMETQDLFPENFIVALPTPSNYIGPNQIFTKTGDHNCQLVYINDAGKEEEDGYEFYMKHKKEWDGSLPSSLTDAIYTFYLANALRDLRGDFKAHRSMLINISRFVKVQKHIKFEVEKIHDSAYRSIKFNLSHNFEESMKDPVIKKIYDNWNANYHNVEFTWDQIVDTLFSSIENIMIKVVNSSRVSEKLEYPENESVRVIAIGGLALSRGLTLEGLIISYFFRSTSTYDVLMQMGRWFGYRKNYEDLFRIWTCKSSADWYAEISEATDLLKADMSIMRELGLRPRDFGIRVRNDSKDLKITSYNKMRNTLDGFEFSGYFGGLIETPYLNYDANVHKSNFQLVKTFIESASSKGYNLTLKEVESAARGRYMLTDIPKELISDFISRLKISRFSSDFDTKQISEFISTCPEKSLDKFDVVFLEGLESNIPSLQVRIGNVVLNKVQRKCVVNKNEDRLSIGERGKIGGTADGKAGIIDFNGYSASDIINAAKVDFKADYLKRKLTPFKDNMSYPSDTWFKFIKNRKPLLLIYLIDIKLDKSENMQKKPVLELKNELGETPVVAFGLGFPNDEQAAKYSKTKYKVNKVYNWFERDDILAEGEEVE